MKVSRYNPARDALPPGAHSGDVAGRRAVFVASNDALEPRAWIVVDDYDGDEGVLLFSAPPGDEFRPLVHALLTAVIAEARSIGYATLLAHWRAGWSSAAPVLAEFGFVESGPGGGERSDVCRIRARQAAVPPLTRMFRGR